MPSMSRPLSFKRARLLLLCAPLLTLAACGSTASSGNFKGEEHEVAQTIANLQSDATANEYKKICSEDLAASVVLRLGGQSACEHAIKEQVAEIENFETTVESVKVDPAAKTATATVKSIYGGKSALVTVSLVKEGGKWKIASIR